MADRGVFFALNPLVEQKLLAAADDYALLGTIQADLEEDWDEDWLQDVEDAWDAIHRCLADGSLRCKSGAVLEKCVLGGRQLHKGLEYTASYLTPAEVKQIARELQPITRDGFRERYFALKKRSLFNPYGYERPIDQKGFETAWTYLIATRIFFQKVAQAGMGMVFTVDR